MKTDRTASVQRQRLLIVSAISCALLLSLAGCGGGPEKPEGMPDLTPATITVTYQGQPVEGATVTLAPKSGQYAAAGVTDASGKAVMKTNADFEGVVPGEFLVSISKVEAVAATGGESSSDPAAYAREFENATVAKPKSLIPEKYASFDTSGLTVNVTEGTPVEQTFDLTD